MAKNKSTLIGGNPYVEMREAKDDKLTLRLVYNLGTTTEFDDEGKKVYRKQRKTEKLELWLWNKKHLTPAESEHNRQAKETARIVREEREKEFRTKTHGYVFAADRAKVNFYEWMEDYISEYDKADVRVVQLALKRFREFVKGTGGGLRGTVGKGLRGRGCAHSIQTIQKDGDDGHQERSLYR